MSAVCASVENSHRFVRATNLDCLEIRKVILAHGLINTENASFINIFPRIFSAEHVVHFFPLKTNFVFELLIDSKHVGAGLAEEAEVSNCLLSE